MSDHEQSQESEKTGLNWEIGRSILSGCIDEKHLHYKQYQMVKTCCEEAAQIIKDTTQETSKRVHSRDCNTVIGVVGERGSGKTSFLYSLKESFPEEYFVLDVVDPSDFGSGMSVLELFLAQMFDAYKELYPIFEKKHGELSSLGTHSHFKDLAKTLSTLRIDESVYSSENPSIEVLANMVSRVNIRQSIQALCTNFLDMVNGVEGSKKTCIALFVDDVDMVENKQVYRMLEDIRKFLSGNIIVIMSYRETQLLDSVIDQKLEENILLIKEDIIKKEEIQKQASRFVSKLVPMIRAVRLYGKDYLMEHSIVSVLHSLELKEGTLEKELISRYEGVPGITENVTVETWLDAVLYAKTLIKINPVNGLEKTSFIYPENLRELISLVEIIQKDMKLPASPTNEEGDYTSRYKDIQRNLARYREYFMFRLPGLLGNNYAEEIFAWSNMRMGARNHYIYKIISELYENHLPVSLSSKGDVFDTSDLTVGKLLNVDLMRPENVTVGDIASIINQLIRACSDNKQLIFLGYSIKLLYSMELLSLLLTALLEMGDSANSAGYESSVEDYLILLNVCIIPPEAMRGGDISRMYNPSHEEFDLFFETWNSENRELLVGEKLHELFSVVLSMLSCSDVPISSLITRSSRLQRQVRYRGDFDDAYNRPLFFVDIEERETNEEDESMPTANQFNSGLAYWMNPLNLFGKKRFVKEGLEAARLSKSSYLFYSLFDIDVFQRMTFNLKKGSNITMKAYLRRLNAAIVNSYLAHADRDPLVSTNTVMSVKSEHERDLYRKICSGFVLSENYRLFSDDPTPPFPSLEEINEVFAFSSYVSSKNRNKYVKIDQFISQGRKEDISLFVDQLIDKLESNALPDEIESLQETRTHLGIPRTRVNAKVRTDLKDLFRRYPNEFSAAFPG